MIYYHVKRQKTDGKYFHCVYSSVKNVLLEMYSSDISYELIFIKKIALFGVRIILNNEEFLELL